MDEIVKTFDEEARTKLKKLIGKNLELYDWERAAKFADAYVKLAALYDEKPATNCVVNVASILSDAETNLGDYTLVRAGDWGKLEFKAPKHYDLDAYFAEDDK